MAQRWADPERIRSYHAHIYYDQRTRPIAERLRTAIGERFTVELGRWHDEPVGPHPVSMYQVAFAVEELPRLLPWLMLNRDGLNVLVHPQTGYSYDDHALHAVWLGDKLPLRLDGMKRRQEAAQNQPGAGSGPI